MSEPYYVDDLVTLFHGDALTLAPVLETGSVQTIVTSPPYFGLRDYGHPDQLGAEGSVGEYVANLVAVFGALRSALSDDGTLWLNLGDSYSTYAANRGASTSFSRNDPLPEVARGSGFSGDRSAKNLLGVPWRVAFALQDDGWVLRSDIIWAKPNPMPESVTDRPTKAHEYLFLFAKSPRYYYDAAAVREPDKGRDHARSVLDGQPSLNPSGGVMAPHRGLRTPAGRDGLGANKRTVWEVATVPFSEAHFAVYPPELIRPCILAGSRPGDVVLDPFSGSGTTGMVATQEGRRYVGFDLNSEYLDLSLRTRFAQPVLDLTGGAA